MISVELSPELLERRRCLVVRLDDLPLPLDSVSGAEPIRIMHEMSADLLVIENTVIIHVHREEKSIQFRLTFDPHVSLNFFIARVDLSIIFGVLSIGTGVHWSLFFNELLHLVIR